MRNIRSWATSRDKVRWIGGAAAALALAACAALEPAEPPRVSLSDVRLLGGGLLEQRLMVEVRIGNPNNFDLPLEGLTVDLDVNGYPFAQGYSNESVTVPRLGEATVPVVATTTVFDMVQQAFALNNRAAISYKLSGKAYIKGHKQGMTDGIPYEKTGSLQLAPGSGPKADSLIPL